MVVTPKKKQGEKREAAEIRQDIVDLANEIGSKMEKNSREQTKVLTLLVNDAQFDFCFKPRHNEDVAKGALFHFPEELRGDFEKLQNLLIELKGGEVEVQIGLEEGQPALAFGSYTKYLTDVVSEKKKPSAFTQSREGPVERPIKDFRSTRAKPKKKTKEELEAEEIKTLAASLKSTAGQKARALKQKIRSLEGWKGQRAKAETRLKTFKQKKNKKGIAKTEAAIEKLDAQIAQVEKELREFRENYARLKEIVPYKRDVLWMELAAYDLGAAYGYAGKALKGAKKAPVEVPAAAEEEVVVAREEVAPREQMFDELVAETAKPQKKVEKPLKPKKPKRLTRAERALMAQLDIVTKKSKEIYKSQYKVGKDYLEAFLADYKKLQKLLKGKKVRAYTRDYAAVRLRAANVVFWTKYAQNRLSPPPKPKKKDAGAIEIPLREGSAQRLMPGKEAMEWIAKEYRKKTGGTYDGTRDLYIVLQESYSSADKLTSKLRFAEQIAETTERSHKALSSLEKRFKKAFPDEADAFDALLKRVDSAAQSARKASQPTMEQLYSWAGNSVQTKRYLQANQAALEKLVEIVHGAELAKVLEYIDAAVKSELEGTRNPRPRPRVALPKGTDFPAVREGLSVLYAAKGLQKPLFKKTKALRKSLKGHFILVDTSNPELFVRPKKTDIFPPADKDGNVFIKYKGRTIWLIKGQKDLLEDSLREGKVGYTEVAKHGKKSTQVDAAGADLLVQYLRSKGWTNVETTEWIGGRARAGLRTLEVPAGYWDRPVARVAEAEVKQKPSTEKVQRREADELLRLAVFEIPKPRDARFGRVLDAVAERSRFEVANQKEGLEHLINTPDIGGTVFFENVGVARNAAKMLRVELLGRNDLRAVTVQVVRDYWGRVEGAYLTVGILPENAFMQRSKTPLVVPASYDKVNLLSSPAERITLQRFLNGKTKKTISFKLGKQGKDTLQAYLSRIGYPPESVEYTQLIKAEVDALSSLERIQYGDTVWEVTFSPVEIPPAPKEEGESIAVRGIRGGGKLQKGRAEEYYGSTEYRMELRTWYSNSEAWLEARLERKAAEKGEKRDYFVSHGMEAPSNVYKTYSQDYRKMTAEQRAYTALASGAQGFTYLVLGKDKGRLFWQNEIAKKHLTDSHIVERPEGARFSQDVQAEVIEHMLYMHTGPGKMLKKDKTYYPERSAQMLAVLSKYKSIDEFADALNNEYAAAAIYDAALQLTEEALALDLSYMTMSPSEQLKKREATFDMMWRSYVSLVGFETGNRPSANPEALQREECAGALVNYLGGRGENNAFTAGGHKYKTLEAIVVRYNGKNVLAVPYIDEEGKIDPKWTYIVGERVRRTAPEGYVFWEVKLYDEEKMFKVRTKRAWSDSIGPAGLTYRYVWGTNPPKLNVDEKPPEELSLITMFDPEYYGPSGYVSTANDLYWDQLGVSLKAHEDTSFEQMTPQKARARMGEVLSELPNGTLLLSTLSGEMMVEESQFFIHPPRTRFSPNGREIKTKVKYPTFRTYAYSSAYVDFDNGDAVYAFRKAGDKLDSPDFVPANARQYADMSEAERKKKGIFKIRVGTFDRRNKTITYDAGKEEIFDKHIMGSWAANLDDVRVMTQKEKEEMGTSPETNRYYYVVESSHTAKPVQESMEVGSHERIGVTGDTRENGVLYVSGNIPILSGEWKKEEKR